MLSEGAPTAVSKATCQFVYDEVGARHMRDLLTIELYDKGVLVSKRITWSIESFVAQTRESSENADLLDAVNAMLIYGDTVAEFFDSTNQ